MSAIHPQSDVAVPSIRRSNLLNVSFLTLYKLLQCSELAHPPKCTTFQLYNVCKGQREFNGEEKRKNKRAWSAVDALPGPHVQRDEQPKSLRTRRQIEGPSRARRVEKCLRFPSPIPADPPGGVLRTEIPTPTSLLFRNPFLLPGLRPHRSPCTSIPCHPLPSPGPATMPARTTSGASAPSSAVFLSPPEPARFGAASPPPANCNGLFGAPAGI